MGKDTIAKGLVINSWDLKEALNQKKPESKVTETNAVQIKSNVTLTFEQCCVTKIRFTRVCMGTLWVCFKYLKSVR